MVKIKCLSNCSVTSIAGCNLEHVLRVLFLLGFSPAPRLDSWKHSAAATPHHPLLLQQSKGDKARKLVTLSLLTEYCPVKAAAAVLKPT